MVDGLAMPNGMGLSPDGTEAYVSETYTGRIVGWTAWNTPERHIKGAGLTSQKAQGQAKRPRARSCNATFA